MPTITNNEIVRHFRAAVRAHITSNEPGDAELAQAVALMGIVLMLHETNFQLTELNQRLSNMDATLVNWSNQR